MTHGHTGMDGLHAHEHTGPHTHGVGVGSADVGVATEYCDKHGGMVPAGTTRTLDRGSRYRVCDACVAPMQHARCGYAMGAHVDGRCPTEDEAVAAWGRS